MFIETTAERNRLERYLLNSIDKAIADWRSSFDAPPEMNLDFAIDTGGILRLNGIALCPIQQLQLPLKLEHYDDLFVLRTDSGQIIEISIVWPFEEGPYISSISVRFFPAFVAAL